jgi:hypothetical protein
MVRIPGLRLCLLGVGLQVLLTLSGLFILLHWDEEGRAYAVLALICLLGAYATIAAQVKGLGRFAGSVGRSRTWGWLALASIFSWPALLMPLALYLLWVTRPGRPVGS